MGSPGIDPQGSKWYLHREHGNVNELDQEGCNSKAGMFTFKGPLVQGFTLPGKYLANKLFSVEQPVYLHWFCNQGMPSTSCFTSVHPTRWTWQLANTPLPCHHFSLLLRHPKEQEEILSSRSFWVWSKICISESQPWGSNGLALNQLRHLWACCQKCTQRREMRIQGYICSSISLPTQQ